MFQRKAIESVARRAGLDVISVQQNLGGRDVIARMDLWRDGGATERMRHVETFRRVVVLGAEWYEGEHGPASLLAMLERLEGA